MTSRTLIERQVILRAGNRCEYCRMHQSLQGGTFHIEHIYPLAHGGDDTLDNLALACPGCNLRKSDRVDYQDPETGERVRLFNPRQDAWTAHLAWNGYEVVGVTDIGRTTIALLELNHERRILIRQAESLFELFPPSDNET